MLCKLWFPSQTENQKFTSCTYKLLIPDRRQQTKVHRKISQRVQSIFYPRCYKQTQERRPRGTWGTPACSSHTLSTEVPFDGEQEFYCANLVSFLLNHGDWAFKRKAASIWISYRIRKSRTFTPPQKKKKEKKYKNYCKSRENISVLTLFLLFQTVLNMFIQTYEKCNHAHTCSFILETLFVEIVPKIMGSVFRYTENPLLGIASSACYRYHILQISEPWFLIHHASLQPISCSAFWKHCKDVIPEEHTLLTVFFKASSCKLRVASVEMSCSTYNFVQGANRSM